jgi:hypothetical protein
MAKENPKKLARATKARHQATAVKNNSSPLSAVRRNTCGRIFFPANNDKTRRATPLTAIRPNITPDPTPCPVTAVKTIKAPTAIKSSTREIPTDIFPWSEGSSRRS